MSAALDHLAARATTDPAFLAFALAEYARSERLDDAGLAGRLGCRPGDLAAVRLCRAPRSDPDGFRADLTAVATRFGLDTTALAAAVQLARGVAQLRGAAANAADPGWVVAARDRENPDRPTT
ncbi:MAG TPA: hypothetical protein VH092_03375 [Urbifossiella sp.]|jgi:hypothetical protein|nr:hypothetical protein [Urbifossiella sp.]